MLSVQKNISSLQRTLGISLFFRDTSVLGLLSQKTYILDNLSKNGCICIKDVNFKPFQMVKFTQGIWKQVISLPKFLMFDNQDKAYNQVARVGNVLLDGTFKDSKKQAAYWHQDGDFWGQGNNKIYNCLHTKQQPIKGGNTHVLDLVQAANYLKNNRPSVYIKVKNLIGLLNIEEIQDFKAFNAKNTLGIQTVTKHKILKRYQNHDQVLFLSVQQLIHSNDLSPSRDLTIQQLLNLLETEMGFYSHKWQKGDLLIWDNLQVMHRSSGNFEGRRLLYRTQGKF